MKKITLVLCVLLLTGCSAKFAYNNATWLVYWYLDDYVELNKAQEEQFDEMLARWLRWHKQVELPKYQAQLEDIINDIKLNNLNQESIASHQQRMRQHWVRSRTHVAPDVVKLATTLSEKQIINLFAKLESDNQEAQEEWLETEELDEQERAKKWMKRNNKSVKKWIGKLSNEQKQFVAQFHERFINTRQYWLRYKREYQKQLREVFEMPDRQAQFQESLLVLITEPEKYRSEKFQAIVQQNNQASSEYIMGLLALASNKQIDHLLEEIDDFRQDVISLQE